MNITVEYEGLALVGGEYCYLSTNQCGAMNGNPYQMAVKVCTHTTNHDGTHSWEK